MKNAVVSVAADVIRARVQAMSALHVYLNGMERSLLTADHNPALNQSIVFAFSRAVMCLRRWVDSFKIDPENFYENPVDLLQLEIVFKVGDEVEINWEIVRRALEEYISDHVIHDVYGCQGILQSEYLAMSNESADALVALFEMPEMGSPLRIKRSY